MAARDLPKRLSDEQSLEAAQRYCQKNGIDWVSAPVSEKARLVRQAKLEYPFWRQAKIFQELFGG